MYQNKTCWYTLWLVVLLASSGAEEERSTMAFSTKLFQRFQKQKQKLHGNIRKAPVVSQIIMEREALMTSSSTTTASASSPPLDSKHQNGVEFFPTTTANGRHSHGDVNDDQITSTNHQNHNNGVNRKKNNIITRAPIDLVQRGGAKPTVGGTSSIPASIFNLVNNVAGAGILTLSAGMASGTGWMPAMLICAGLGLLSSHTFSIIGHACELTGETDFKGLWARTIGSKSTYIVDGIIAIMCLACTVIYSGILGDVFTPLLDQAGLPAQFNARSSNIVAVTLTLLFPMCLIKNLSALAFTSLLGFSAIMYTVVFIVIRALDGSYKLGTGKFVTDGVLQTLPAFAKSSLWNMDFTSLVLASNLGLAYIAHYNGPAFYRELRNTNSKRFTTMVRLAFTVLTALYIITMVSGYSTFGDVCQGNLLLNYHPSDILSTLGRLATGFSILFGYPLVAAGAREGIAGFASGLGRPGVGKAHMALVASILSFATVVACTVSDVSLVVGLTGAAMGSTIVYVIPAIIFIKSVGMTKGWDSSEYKRARLLNVGLVPFGIFIGALGVFMTLKNA